MTKKKIEIPPMPAIAVDTREPVETAYTFGDRHPLERVALPTADYSLRNFEAVIGFERKTLDDFIASVIHERERFWRELERFARFQVRAVVVEGAVSDIEAHLYTSAAAPLSVIASAQAIVTDFSIPVWWAGSRERAEAFVEWGLVRFWKRQHVRRVDEDEVTA